MNAIGIIAEYNPFHNGHLYHINKIKERVKKFKNLTDEKIFDNYVEIETRIFDLYQDSYDAMCYLDGYIQYLVDQYRGK